MENNYIQSLNEEQRRAVLYNDGPVLIVAGAGSGKTRVLTCKVARLLEEGYDPSHLLALTFTNKAAREMKERVAKLVDARSAYRIWMGTFHSMFLRILRAESQAFGYPSDFSIYDTTDTKNLLKAIIKEMQLDEKVYKPSMVYSRISIAKNEMHTPQDYLNNPDYQERDKHSRTPMIGQIYAQYVRRCRQAKAMDFDDILLFTNNLFKEHPDILAQWQEHFQYILVDEYQDTNYSQYLIVRQLAACHHRVCVVGDDSQSIYSFRGANIENILKFQQSYPDCRVYRLERNYRSTQNIVNLANSLIRNNRNRLKKNIYSEREPGSLIHVRSAVSDGEEAYLVASRLSEWRIRKQDSWGQFAVLYRTNAQSRLLEEALRKRGIPYRIYGGMSFFQRAEVKDVLAYLRLMVNPDDEESFKRALNYPPRGIGDTTRQRLVDAANAAGVSLWEVLGDPMKYQLPVNKGTLAKLEAFRQLMTRLQALQAELNVYDFTTRLISESGISVDLQRDTTIEGVSRKENIDSLLAGMNEFCQSALEEGRESAALSEYLSEVALQTDQDQDKDSNAEKVTLMTIHASKGLEFNNVVVTGLEENLFPSAMAQESDRELEEERRLLYVAITRAGNECMLTYAKSRFRNGQTEYSRPSRFLKELDGSLIDLPRASAPSSPMGTPASSTGYGASRSGGYGQSKSGGYGQPRPSGSYGSAHGGSYGSAHSGGSYGTSARPAAPAPAQSQPRKWTKLPSTPGSSAPSAVPASEVNSNKGMFRVGQMVLHERFGRGRIRSIEGAGPDCKIGVDFEHLGYKLLLLKFANMKPME